MTYPRLLLVLCVALLGAALSLPAAAPAKACSPPSYPGSGYFTSLKAQGVTCAFGRKLTLAHHRCRTAGGPAGRCRRKVLRYSCKEVRTRIPTEINGRVTCTRSAKRVVYTYQQNL
jgi:hypothetical protein